MHEFRATPNFSPAIIELNAAMRSGRLRHDGTPVLEWCLGNVVGKADRRGNLCPTTSGPDQKVDAGVALMMAIGRPVLYGVSCASWLVNRRMWAVSTAAFAVFTIRRIIINGNRDSHRRVRDIRRRGGVVTALPLNICAPNLDLDPLNDNILSPLLDVRCSV